MLSFAVQILKQNQWENLEIISNSSKLDNYLLFLELLADMSGNKDVLPPVRVVTVYPRFTKFDSSNN